MKRLQLTDGEISDILYVLDEKREVLYNEKNIDNCECFGQWLRRNVQASYFFLNVSTSYVEINKMNNF